MVRRSEKEIMQTAAEGTIKEVTDWWPRPGSDKPLEKMRSSRKTGDQICGVGYSIRNEGPQYTGETCDDRIELAHR